MALIKNLQLEEGQIRDVVPTKTGWAIKPVNLEVRDKPLEAANIGIIKETLGASIVETPSEWVVYVVPGGPGAIPDILDEANG